MGDDLMAEKVEIDPFVRGSAFPAAKQLPVKRARLGEIANGKGKVKTGAVWHHGVVAFACESEAPARVFTSEAPGRVFAKEKSRLCR